jgi:hypothetical protein
MPSCTTPRSCTCALVGTSQRVESTVGTPRKGSALQPTQSSFVHFFSKGLEAPSGYGVPLGSTNLCSMPQGSLFGSLEPVVCASIARPLTAACVFVGARQKAWGTVGAPRRGSAFAAQCLLAFWL